MLRRRSGRVREPGGAPGRRTAGEGLVFRDEQGRYYVIPVEAVRHSAVQGDDIATIERELSAATGLATPAPFSSGLLGECEFLGVRSGRLIIRDSGGRYFALGVPVLKGARVPAAAVPCLVEQLPRRSSTVIADGVREAPVEFLGLFQISYEPSPEDTSRKVGARLADRFRAPASRTAGDGDLDEARRRFLEAGWSVVSDGAFDNCMDAVVREGTGLVRSASHEYEIASEEDVLIRMRRYATTGAALEAVHQAPAVVSALRAVSGALVVPTHCAYYFYRGDDYISLHTDASYCPLTVLVRVHGDPPPLMICPELRGCSPERLRAVVEQTGGHPENGTPMHFPARGAVVFEGCEIPHHRAPGRADSGFVGVAQLCYRSVWHRTQPPRRMVAARPVSE